MKESSGFDELDGYGGNGFRDVDIPGRPPGSLGWPDGISSRSRNGQNIVIAVAIDLVLGIDLTVHHIIHFARNRLMIPV
jgi:hypothetical protein